jgi:RNA-binding protein
MLTALRTDGTRFRPCCQVSITSWPLINYEKVAHLMPQNTAKHLTSKQRAKLRAYAHHLKPILQVGKEGVADATVDAAIEAFNTREVMKIKVLENAPLGVRESADALAERIEGARVVQVIGRTVVLFRSHPEHPRMGIGG